MGVVPYRRQLNRPHCNVLRAHVACQLKKKVIGVGALARLEQKFQVFVPVTMMGRTCWRVVVDAFRVHVDLVAVVEQPDDSRDSLPHANANALAGNVLVILTVTLGSILSWLSSTATMSYIVLQQDGRVEGRTDSIARLVWVEPMVRTGRHSLEYDVVSHCVVC